MPRPVNKASCNTCRRRKLKCDQATPVCRKCAKSNRYCDRSDRSAEFRASHLDAAAAQIIGQSDASSKTPRDALQDQKIARLFHHYISDLSKWYDLSDAASAFEVTVPLISLQEPLLFFAIISLSAMHMSKTTASSFRTTAENYHDRCVQLLINIKENDAVMTGGVALAATCLLRSYEILDSDIDPNMHLRGAYSMVSIQDILPGELHRGLLAAGFWNFLREDITFSLFKNCPLKIDLKFVSLSVDHDSDQDYLNSITLILGRIINIAFDHSFSVDEWKNTLELVRQWSLTCPRRLRPFSSQPGGPGTNDLFPRAWFLQPCHASVMHYYFTTLVVLIVHSSTEGFQDLQSLDLHEYDLKAKEDLLEAMAMEICGIAFTKKTPSVVVNAFGPMSYCSKFIRTEAPRQELTRQLLACKSSIGWPVQRLVDDLETLWRASGV
ncbi:hypothetical protein B0J13DRAFT_246189 [Dactylonectria estremocensis]|uniref:Zn(2)-C6 fungal-type domain-containing protein n=1 Tax=Dactylonectria estremocensis TaxID=1079267 RepID=A0A9P9F3K1_9HYPO|nr:hypothetical protein B0J13DRAFT_246189 [Dactylonectria estremocensis]